MKWLYSKQHLPHKRLVLALFVASIFYSLHYALTLYLGSLFLGQFIDENLVGLVYLVGALISLYVTFELSHFLNRFTNYKILIWSCVLEIFTLLGLALSHNAPLSISLFIFQGILINTIFFSINIALNEVSKRNESGSVRGIYFTLINLGVLSSAYFSGILFAAYSFSGVFTASAVLLLPVLYIAYRYVHSIEEPHYKDISFIASVRHIYKNKDIRDIAIIQFILESFFVVMVIYAIPYLHEVVGIPTETILQTIMPIALLPFVIFPYELGVLADTKIGEKELIIVGMFIAGVSVLLIPFITTTNILIWACILFMTRVGASFMEDMASVYFFKKIHKDEAGAITLFTNGTKSLALIIVPVVATIMLTVLNMPRNSVFILLSLLLFLGVYHTRSLRDTL